MISSVRGLVLSALGTTIVVEVGGLGFSVQVTPAAALGARVGQETQLMTTLIVREDSLTLYGFASASELAVFELLVGVTGVGPKSALGVLAALTPDQVAHAVNAEDDAVFRKVSGIGPKTAKLIVLSLAGKVFVTSAGAQAAGGERRGGASGTAAAVEAALVGLGWSEKVAAEAVELTLAEATDAAGAAGADLPVAAVLRLALARLGPSRPATTGRVS